MAINFPDTPQANTTYTVNSRTWIYDGEKWSLFFPTATINVQANASTLTGTALNSSVVSSNLTSVGTLTTLTVSGNINVTGTVIDNRAFNSSPPLSTGTYTLVLTDNGKIIEMNSIATCNVSIPTDSTVNFPIGASIDVIQIGTGQAVIVPVAGVTLNSANSYTKLRTRWSTATLIKRASNTWVVIGDLSA